MSLYEINYKLEVSRKILFNKLEYNKCENLLDVLDLSSGDYLPTSKMIGGQYKVYGGGGVTEYTHNEYNVAFETLGIGRVGARCGCVFIIDKYSWITDNALYAKSINENFDIKFLKHYLNFLHLNQFSSQTAQPVISKKKIKHIRIPVIDYSVQKKLGELLESIENNNTNLELAEECNIKKILEMVEKWEILNLNLENLINGDFNIGCLRQNILQEAVQGKLVPQDPNDEPASVLLERIKEEKERLIKEGKIKKEKPLPPITVDEIPYELPEGWEWVRLKEMTENIHYGYTASAIYNDTGIKFLRITDIQDNKVNWDTVPFCEIEEGKLKTYLLRNNDILIARTGGTIGKSFIVKDIKHNAVFASYLIRVISLQGVNPDYIKLFLETPLYWEQLIRKSKGTGQPNVNAVSLSNLVIPLPPLNEQKRIVEKVDQLMALCDELEKNIEQSKKDSEMLMQSVLQEAFKEA